MPPKGRGRTRRQILDESEAQNVGDDVEQHSIPIRRRARQVDEEVDLLASRADEMELVMAIFQRMNAMPRNPDYGNPGFTAGRGFNTAGGTPEGG
ncbi:pentatricopeptide repeat-containing protein chloroplastic [Dorcoceras hygrometricum]|uniref:Pentatricopeptide repeat-containing protein chloroplastic n=1 Tax=Dorcoceras hygrometricum TaxID=472368 RepID=A0A2Z7D0Q3_9LAMI|nr:pentatricopeptide repeat-containing protein chloroplastic [Dorcoceras hygrometricum]